MTELNIERELMNAVRDGIGKVIEQKLGGYNSPLDKLLESVVASQSADIRRLFLDAIEGSMNDVEFREQIKVAVRHKLAQQLIQKFGGELEKQVNLLKSDPTTRAQITVAIAEIVKAKAQ